MNTALNEIKQTLQTVILSLLLNSQTVLSVMIVMTVSTT